MPVMIDAHHHLWDIAAREHRWLAGGQPWASDAELSRLRRSFTLADLAPLAGAEGVAGTVVIQTVTEPWETPDLLELAAGGGLLAGATTLTADGWGSVPRSYVVCTRDRAIQPAMQRKFIELADAAFPGNPTTVHTLDSSHSPFLSMPGRLADIILRRLSTVRVGVRGDRPVGGRGLVSAADEPGDLGAQVDELGQFLGLDLVSRRG
jgi:Alpha/beta hydrolase family